MAADRLGQLMRQLVPIRHCCALRHQRAIWVGSMTRILIVFAALLSAASAAAHDDTSYSHRKLLGFVEWVTVEPAGLRLKARLDTGALTSSLHSVDTQVFQRDGEDWVRFHVPVAGHRGTDEEAALRVLALERPVTRVVLVKRKGAPPQRRYVVELTFCLDGRRYETEFSLTDRGEFIYPALLGRRFLKDVAVVDPANSFLAGEACSCPPQEGLGQSVLELETEEDSAEDGPEEDEAEQ